MCGKLFWVQCVEFNRMLALYVVIMIVHNQVSSAVKDKSQPILVQKYIADTVRSRQAHSIHWQASKPRRVYVTACRAPILLTEGRKKTVKAYFVEIKYQRGVLCENISSITFTCVMDPGLYMILAAVNMFSLKKIQIEVQNQSV